MTDNERIDELQLAVAHLGSRVQALEGERTAVPKAVDPTATLPCPFCASNVAVELADDTGFYVRCFGCGAIGPRNRFARTTTKERAVEQWNNRKQLKL